MRIGTDTFSSQLGARALSAIAVAGLLVGSGCVTSGTYEASVKERDALANENDGLAREKAELESRIEWLEQENRKLATEVHSQTSEADQLRDTFDTMVSQLESEVEQGRVTIEQLRDGISVNVAQEILFPTGSAVVSQEGREVLGKVSQELAKVDYVIEVQGHTDNVPISTVRYPSNWELAGARAASVVRMLEENGIGGGRMVATSFAEHEPVAPNDSEDGRARNRRIEIQLKPIPVDADPDEATSLPAAADESIED